MKHPEVSIVIPACNQADYISETIRSVLNQTFSNWELIVVDDGSTDSTADVVASFDDPRIQYLYQKNRGLPAARNTGIDISLGSYLAFLDADDFYHVDKLKAQVAHLDHSPEIGLGYGSRIEIDNQGNYLSLHRAPAQISLETLVMGFPFTINDILVRREWVDKISGFDESFVLNSEDRDFYLRLALAGCRFGGVDKVVAFRRLHVGRSFQNLEAKLDMMLRALDTAFDDSRCPAEVATLRDRAYAIDYLSWAYQGFVQDETLFAQENLRIAVRLDPCILCDRASMFLRFLVHASTRDRGEHKTSLRKVFAQLPSEMGWLSNQCDWAVARGYLLRGARDVMWGRLEEGNAHCTRAAQLGATIDENFLRGLTDQLLNYEAEFGRNAAQDVLSNLAPYLEQIGDGPSIRWFKGLFAFNRAFRDYRDGLYANVPLNVLSAISHDPTYLTNRGLMAILIRSLLGRKRTTQDV